jgi:ubiquinone/menaquinone biosynthesis C-methylase UbiE
VTAALDARDAPSGGGRAPTQYDDVADLYEERVVPHFRAIARRLVADADIRRGDRVLEIGAGTGGLSRLVAPLVGSSGSLVLADASSGMLGVAGRVMAALEPGPDGLPPVETVVASLESLPVEDAAFDLVTAQMTPLLDSEAGLGEAFRVLRTGGRLAVAAWGAHYQETRLLNTARASVGVGPYPVVRLRAIGPRLERAGFVDIRRRTRRMTAVHPTVEAYLDYRRGFGTVGYAADQVESYFATLERSVREAFAAARPIRIGWSITTVTARKPGGEA